MNRVRDAYTWRSPWLFWPPVKKRCGVISVRLSRALVMPT
nr:hypothetical protein RTCK_02254 [Rhizobium sp. TCK]